MLLFLAATITMTKLNWKNYLSWSTFMELWFLGQLYHDHLEKEVSAIPNEDKLSGINWISRYLLFYGY